MPQPIYANNVAGTMGANIGPSDTAVLLGAGQGASFPAVTAGNWYYATLVHATLATWEVVKVTGKSVDTLTVVRGQDGTSAQSFTIGSLVEMRLPAQALRELDWRNYAGFANGLAQLGGDGKVPDAQLSANVPIMVGGKLQMANIPDAVALDSELANYLPLAGGTVTGNLGIVGNLTVDTAGAGAARLNVGNDAYLMDVNVGNMMGLRSVANAAVGFLAFGSGNHYVGWNGGAFVADGNNIWHAGNFDPASKANQSNPYIAGDVRVTSYFRSDGGYFISQTAHLVLGSQSGPIYMRPNGELNGTNQGVYNTSGLFQAVDVQSYSDKKFKKKIRKWAVDLDIANKLDPKQWLRKSDNTPGWGVVAQDLLARGLDRHVGGDAKAGYSVDYARLAFEVSMANSYAIKALQKKPR